MLTLVFPKDIQLWLRESKLMSTCTRNLMFWSWDYEFQAGKSIPKIKGIIVWPSINQAVRPITQLVCRVRCHACGTIQRQIDQNYSILVSSNKLTNRVGIPLPKAKANGDLRQCVPSTEPWLGFPELHDVYNYKHRNYGFKVKGYILGTSCYRSLP